MDIYGHLMQSVNTEASRRLEEQIFGGHGNNLVTKMNKERKPASLTSWFLWCAQGDSNARPTDS